MDFIIPSFSVLKDTIALVGLNDNLGVEILNPKELYPLALRISFPNQFSYVYWN
jgi:hypothetical protein